MKKTCLDSSYHTICSSSFLDRHKKAMLTQDAKSQKYDIFGGTSFPVGKV